MCKNAAVTIFLNDLTSYHVLFVNMYLLIPVFLRTREIVSLGIWIQPYNVVMHNGTKSWSPPSPLGWT